MQNSWNSASDGLWGDVLQTTFTAKCKGEFRNDGTYHQFSGSSEIKSKIRIIETNISHKTEMANYL